MSFAATKTPVRLTASSLGEPGLNRPTQSQTTAANAAAAALQQMHQQALPAQPGNPSAVPNPQINTATGAAATPVNLSITPGQSSQNVGSTFQVSVMLGNGRNIASVPLQLKYNPAVLQLVNVDAGDFLSRDGQPVALAHRDEGNGLVSLTASRPPGVAGISGQGNIATFTFKAITPGDARLSLTKVGAMDTTQTSLPATGSEANVHVQ